jgi:putative acetyltransferase
MLIIRPEKPEDSAAVRQLLLEAFGQPIEADLVEQLRARKGLIVSLVATVGGEIIGHIVFSRVSIEGAGQTSTGAGLGPVAVSPGHQKKNVGSQLVRAGLEECKRLNYSLVFVLGEPAFYRSFGFFSASAHGISWRDDVPEGALMVLELQKGSLGGVRGTVRYQPEFEVF